MNRYARGLGALGVALGLHGLLFLWPLAIPPQWTPPSVSVSVLSRSVASVASSPTPRQTPPAPSPRRSEEASPVPAPTPEVSPPSEAPLTAPAEPESAALGPAVPDPSPASPAADSGTPAAEGSLTPSEPEALGHLAEAWAGEVRAMVDAKKSYPYAARAQGLQGRVTVAFVISGTGQVSDPRVTVSAGYPTLDRAALAAVTNAGPFPPAPGALGPGPWPFTVTLVFTLR